MILRSGLDLVEISRLENLREEIRNRFIQRVFTEQEQKQSKGNIASLAGRFAAKEAVAKALGCGIGAVGWKEIEVLSGGQGQPVLELHGNAVRMAAQQGLKDWTISITHTGTTAAAVAIALGN